ncbi:hypothetical protein BV20DRAFT_829458 [Pilatotrama ljubarskyi]|nr:hypothetical protein BV20DRAFT_829458 [Pilatotrama ljubarskyi]
MLAGPCLCAHRSDLVRALRCSSRPRVPSCYHTLAQRDSQLSVFLTLTQSQLQLRSPTISAIPPHPTLRLCPPHTRSARPISPLLPHRRPPRDRPRRSTSPIIPLSAPIRANSGPRRPAHISAPRSQPRAADVNPQCPAILRRVLSAGHP